MNLFLIKDRLTRAAITAEPDETLRPWYRRIRQTVGIEVLLVSTVLVATSVLIGLPPARQAYGRGVVVRAQTADLRFVLVVNPGKVGINTFDIYLKDSLGRPIIDAEKVAIIFSMVERDIGETEVVAESQGGAAIMSLRAATSHWTAPGAPSCWSAVPARMIPGLRAPCIRCMMGFDGIPASRAKVPPSPTKATWSAEPGTTRCPPAKAPLVTVTHQLRKSCGRPSTSTKQPALTGRTTGVILEAA